jgi:hypothetical protein
MQCFMQQSIQPQACRQAGREYEDGEISRREITYVPSNPVQ